MSNQHLDAYVTWLRERYAGSVLHGSPVVVHDADCMSRTIGLCTCGLLDCLARIVNQADGVYPKFTTEHPKHIICLAFLRDNAREIDRRLARYQSAVVKTARDMLANPTAGLVELDKLTTVLDQQSLIGRSSAWNFRAIEDMLVDLFDDHPLLHGRDDRYIVLGQMKYVLYNIYQILVDYEIQQVPPPTADVTGNAQHPSLVWLNGENGQMLRLYYDTEDCQFWLHLSDIYTAVGRSRVIDDDIAVVEAVRQFMGDEKI